MLRHSTGYALADRGMDTRRLQHYLGQASITNTVSLHRNVTGAVQGHLALKLRKMRTAATDSEAVAAVCRFASKNQKSKKGFQSFSKPGFLKCLVD
jgi:hypothetical protein